MSFAKRAMERQEEQAAVASEIALKAGVLKECKYHGTPVWMSGGDLEAAYRFASHRFSHGQYRDMFDSQRELTDPIKNAVEDSAMECYDCARWDRD